jgi:flagellar protein FlaG
MRISGMDAAVKTVQNGSEPQGADKASPASQMIKIQEKSQESTREKSVPQHTEENNQNQVSEKVVSEAIEKLNKALEGTNRRMEYSVHEVTNGIMIKVIDEETGKVIREVPPKKILDMVANMMEMAGLIVDERR